jgi:O-antigen/teichoic acid export membrane protein
VSELRPGAETRRFGRTASLLSAGVGAAGLLTYLFFSLASHNLDKHQYGEIVVLWSAVFVTISVAHRPVEQMLTRTLAERRARGEEIDSALRVGAAIQLGVAILLGALALALRDPLQDGLLSGSETLYWVLVFAVTTFGVSYYARGVFAGTRRFVLLAALLVCESAARTALALAVALGIAEGQSAIALGVAAAPAVSLVAAPIAIVALRRRLGDPADGAGPAPVTVAAGGSFAAAVLIVMLSEQAFLNAGPLLVRAFEDAAAAGFIFNVLMVVRAPVLVFQGVATSLLPHLTRLRTTGSAGETAFHDSIRATLAAIAVFSAVVVAAVAAVGPAAMQAAFGDDFTYDRLGLMLMAFAMGFYLAATTLSQAALAHGAAARGARCWAISAALFLTFCLLPLVEDEARRVEVGFLAGSILLAFLLARVYRSVPAEGIHPDSPEEIEARLAAADEGG